MPIPNDQRSRIKHKNSERDWRAVHGNARDHFLNELREARLNAQKDSESCDQLLFVFERLGAFRLGETATLGSYRSCLLALAQQSALGDGLRDAQKTWHSSAGILYELILEGRNDALHQGARARHLTEHCIELGLLFEDVLMNGDDPMATLRDIMVRSPIIAEPWQPVGFARQIMLTNSFSYLPIYTPEHNEWRLVSDAQIAAMLRRVTSEERGRLLATALEDPILKEHKFKFEPATVERPNQKIASIASALLERPIVLVVDSDEKTALERCKKLVGIVTAFDIL